MRLAAQAKGGFYPTPPRVIDLIAGLIYAPVTYGPRRGRETLRILDPCCGPGEAVAQLAERLTEAATMPIETYGVELHRDRAAEAGERLHRALASDLFQTSIANGAFGLLYLNPHRTIGIPEAASGWSMRSSCTPPATSPTTACSSSSCPASGWRSRRSISPPTTSGSGAGRSPSQSGRRSTRWCSSGAAGRNRTPTCTPRCGCGSGRQETLDELPASPYRELSIPPLPAGDVLFSTRTVDPVSAAAEARRSGLWASAEINDSLWPRGDTRTRPLMPLRRGHMAMLVAAGFLDNLCLEAEGRRILVKGRTTKEMVLVEETPETETYRERLRTTVVALGLDDGEITDIAA